ncbi:hypothetical protein EP47_06980 [Legionella norrlandica]|uniref:Uncharacterized protein n=1 Tax=Legionella norrlandica TaxID=1498499 RepID=A0A0A2ST33_9GAMM|nr:hypothetical protein [Legionella norrlandica]KGP63877.1 hypothetical protein EP47_06980 [Legionella norrlandica]
MLEFSEFQQNALKLTDRLRKRCAPSVGCCSFFSVFVSNSAAIEDAYTIKLVADSLNNENDKKLLNYLRSTAKYPIVTHKDVKEFKEKVLAGIYLMVWSHYHSTVSNFMNRSMIELIQRDLQINSPRDMKDTLFDSSLAALSQYCSFAYQNRNERIYANLMQRLGKTIQADIHTVRFSRENHETSFYDVCKEIMCTLGLHNRFR